MKLGNSRRETQARKSLENEKYETWFHDEKTRLHMAEVSFLIAKTAMCIRSLSLRQTLLFAVLSRLSYAHVDPRISTGNPWVSKPPFKNPC